MVKLTQGIVSSKLEDIKNGVRPRTFGGHHCVFCDKVLCGSPVGEPSSADGSIVLLGGYAICRECRKRLDVKIDGRYMRVRLRIE